MSESSIGPRRGALASALRAVVCMLVGLVLGTGAGFAVGFAALTLGADRGDAGVFFGAIRLGFHAGWIGGLVWWFARRRPLSPPAPGARSDTVLAAFGRAAAATLVGGAFVGGVGFLAGFVGPILFSPDSAQGPLLGIFVTGPLGFVVGCVGGLARNLWRRRRG